MHHFYMLAGRMSMTLFNPKKTETARWGGLDPAT
jgi:hypothetical protein